jgi:hypothetical protein
LLYLIRKCWLIHWCSLEMRSPHGLSTDNDKWSGANIQSSPVSWLWISDHKTDLWLNETCQQNATESFPDESAVSTECELRLVARFPQSLANGLSSNMRAWCTRSVRQIANRAWWKQALTRPWLWAVSTGTRFVTYRAISTGIYDLAERRLWKWHDKSRSIMETEFYRPFGCLIVYWQIWAWLTTPHHVSSRR